MKEIDIEQLHRQLLDKVEPPKLKVEVLADYIERPEQLSDLQRELIKKMIDTYPSVKEEYEFLESYQPPKILLPGECPPKVILAAMYLEQRTAMAAATQFTGSIVMGQPTEPIQLKIYQIDNETYARVLRVDEPYQNESVKLVLQTADGEFESEVILLQKDLSEILLSETEIDLNEVKGISFVPE